MRCSKSLAGITGVLLFVIFIASANGQGNNPGQEPKCTLPGSDWKFIPDLSDEFNGRTMDTSKWYPYNPGWKGREPGYFSPANVNVKHGNLILTSKTETLKNIPAEYHTFHNRSCKEQKADALRLLRSKVQTNGFKGFQRFLVLCHRS